MNTPKSMRLGTGEKVLHLMRTHPKVLFLPTLWLLGTAVTAVAIDLFVPQDIAEGWVYRGLLGALFVLALKYTLWPYLQWWMSRYAVTDKQIITTTGIINRKSHSSQLSRISDIVCERGILDRIFGCGTLIIENAANTAGDPSRVSRVVFHDVPRVGRVEHDLKDLVFHSHTPDSNTV